VKTTTQYIFIGVISYLVLRLNSEADTLSEIEPFEYICGIVAFCLENEKVANPERVEIMGGG